MTEVQIFPEKLLLAETTKELATKLSKINEVEEILVHGPTLPKKVPYGPAKGKDNPHSERGKLQVRGEEVELNVQVGRVFVRVDESKSSLEDILEKLVDVCEETISCGFDIGQGRFEKKESSSEGNMGCEC
ncbi:MAG: Methyl coenzyme M reductase subunit D McrD [Candidatus Methanohalarchaeum thermophilum]|uniref:Methyl coenzyme M reductase subunit D McrD n=1 Tax=Methanohalarchaeum thermophilum TaxID=1903181 RepID=A0A1Q6DVN8_METT1|nr:MAG: Methyl coenzyme M reductase subunit D McrD [Candidatus Methanohalarchaeum thermophilum]